MGVLTEKCLYNT